MTPNQYTDTFKRLSDEKLLSILDNKKDYQPLAIETAIHELNARQLSDKQIEYARQINIETKQRKEEADKKVQERVESAKKTADKALSLLDPFIEKTPERSIRLICFFLGLIAIYKLFVSYSYFEFVLTEASRFGFSDCFMIYDTFFLPITLVLLWKLKNIGRILFSIWLSVNIISTLSLFISIFKRQDDDSPLNYLMPQTDISALSLSLFVSGGLLYYINKKDIRTLFK